MKLTIDRSKWLRGEGSTRSMLLRPSDGKMCCLGFLGLACGVAPHGLLGETVPVGRGPHIWPKWLFMEGRGGTCLSEAARRLVGLNDSMADSGREKEIAAIFADNGVEVEFIDGPVMERGE